jgi:predicted phosphodiesterase
MMPSHIANFDAEHQTALSNLWFCGDVHGYFKHIMWTLSRTKRQDLPSIVVCLRDQDLERPFDDYLLPMAREWRSVSYAYILVNHDCDSWEKHEFLTSTKIAQNIDGKVTLINGIRIAALGGVFIEQVWYPPAAPRLASASAALMHGAFQYRAGQRPSSQYLGAIYPETVDQLSKQQADILLTHEAQECHPLDGHEALSDVARSMGCIRSFHGHTHDDHSNIYRATVAALGYDALAVNYCWIKNGLGAVIYAGSGE